MPNTNAACKPLFIFITHISYYRLIQMLMHLKFACFFFSPIKSTHVKEETTDFFLFNTTVSLFFVTAALAGQFSL